MSRPLYWLDFHEGVKEAIDDLPGHVRGRIKRMIADLRTNPRPAIANRLRAPLDSCYEIALGRWCIVFEPIDDEEAIVLHKVGEKHGPEFFSDIRSHWQS
jgi:mRNA-degrading endonuclease RelE of RelBE toxin-antitoxin system